MYGEIVSGWELVRGRLRVQATVPPNTTASIRLPGADLATVLEHGVGIQAGPGIFSITQDEENLTVEVGSGSYLFEYPYRTQGGAVKENSE
jgi:alpha-L-rhamnosidase